MMSSPPTSTVNRALSPALLDALARAVGPANVLVEGDLSAFELDWRRRWHGRAGAVVRPQSTAEVAAVVKACAAHGASIVPQGGNTGLVGGGVPDETGRQVVLNLQRMQRVRQLDTPNLTLTVEAGCVLQAAQEAARQGHQRRRHAGPALRQRPQPLPGARSGDGRWRGLGWSQRPAQGQHRVRPARRLHRQRRHPGHHHRRHAGPAARVDDADSDPP